MRSKADLSALALPRGPPAAAERPPLGGNVLVLFLAPRGGEGYLELNLSPAGHWKAYRFDS
jgi:hypothetical protein